MQTCFKNVKNCLVHFEFLTSKYSSHFLILFLLFRDEDTITYNLFPSRIAALNINSKKSQTPNKRLYDVSVKTNGMLIANFHSSWHQKNFRGTSRYSRAPKTWDSIQQAPFCFFRRHLGWNAGDFEARERKAHPHEDSLSFEVLSRELNHWDKRLEINNKIFLQICIEEM